MAFPVEPDNELVYVPTAEDETAGNPEAPVDPSQIPDDDPTVSQPDNAGTVATPVEDAGPTVPTDTESVGYSPDNGLPADPAYASVFGVPLESDAPEADQDTGDVYSATALSPTDAEYDSAPGVIPPVQPIEDLDFWESQTTEDFETEDYGFVVGDDATQVPVSYEIQGREPEGAWRTLATVSATEVTTEVRGLPAGEGWTFRIRAVFVTGETGEWSAETLINLPTDLLAPPTPTAPSVKAERGVVTVTWDGLGADASEQPADYKHTVVWVSETGDPSTFTPIGLLFGAGDFLWTNAAYDVNYFFALSSLDLAGNSSARGVATPATLKPLVQEPDIQAEIERIDTAYDGVITEAGELDGRLTQAEADLATAEGNLDTLQNTTLPAMQGELDAAEADLANAKTQLNGRIDGAFDAAAAADAVADSALVAANGKNKIFYSTTAPSNTSNPGSRAGDLWRQLDSSNNVIAEWQWSGSLWVNQKITSAAISNLEVGKLIAGSATIGTAVIDKLWAEVITARKIRASQINVGEFANLATIDETRGVNVTFPATYSTVITGGYVASNPNASNYIMFKDQTTTVPFVANDKLRITFYAKTVGTTDIWSFIRLWTYNNVAEDPNSNGPSYTADYFYVKPTEQFFSVTLTIGSNLTREQQSWIMGLGSGSNVNDIRLRNVRVYRMTGSDLIVNGAVSANHINANSVAGAVAEFIKLDVSQLTASSAAISSAVVDKLWADVIHARKITTEMLAIGDFESFAPSVATDPGAYAYNGDAFAINWSLGYDGKGFQIRANPGGADSDVLGPLRNVRPGDRLYVKFFARLYSSTAINMQCRVYWYKGDGTYVASSFVRSTDQLSGTEGWLEGEAVAPADTAQARVRLWGSGSAAADAVGWVSIHGVTARRMSGGELIVDGAITTLKLASKAITADKIATNAITADKIDGGAIDGQVITGATVRTSATSSRVEMANQKITAWKSGTRIFEVDAANGTAYIAGTFYAGSLGGMLGTDPYYVQIGQAGTGTAIAMGREGYSRAGAIIPQSDGMMLAATKQSVSGDSTYYRSVGMTQIAQSASGGSTGEIGLWYTDLYGNLSPSTGDGYATDTFVGLALRRHGGNYPKVLLYHNYQDSQIPRFTAGEPLMLDTATGSRKVGLQSSLSKYKLNQAAIPEEDDDKILSLNAVTWFDKHEAESMSELMRPRTAQEVVDEMTPLAKGEHVDEVAFDLRRVPGVIAEDVQAAGLEDFLQYNFNGEMTGVKYDRLGVALIPVVRRQRDRIAGLEGKVAGLEAKLEALLARVETLETSNA